MLLLVDSDVPRAAYACARAVTEATQDLMLLVSESSEYDKAGARAYVWELLETERYAIYIGPTRPKGSLLAQQAETPRRPFSLNP